MTLLPRHISLFDALLLTLVAATEDVCTVTLKLHDELPQPFNAVQVTAVVPILNVLPEAGKQFTAAAGVPVAEGVANVTIGLHVIMSAGHAPITGDSLIVTVNEHDELLHEFVAVHVTVEVPVGNVEPEAGTHATDAAGNPVAGGVGKDTT